jgi:hypothetical protein
MRALGTLALIGLVLGLVLAAIRLHGQTSIDLAPEDRLRVREAQLSIQQYNVELLQAQLNLRASQDALGKLVEELKVKYDQGGCQLNNALQFVCPPVKGESNGVPVKEPAKPPEKEKERK